MRRRQIRPYGVTVRPTRMVTYVIAIAVLFMLYGRVRDPNTWQVLLDLPKEAAAAEAPPAAPAAAAAAEAPEVIVPGPNDLDEEEVAKAAKAFELVTDKTELRPRDMFAYWQLMTWSRTEPFEKLMTRAKVDVPFTQFWEQPERYRGKLITLRLHVRRVLEYDAPSNPQELKKCYEAWGWTDESKSFPYVVVFPECPSGLPVGTDVRGEIVFVGYFLKVMKYTAFETNRGAPLLIGRVQALPSRAPAKAAPMDPWLLLGIVVAGFIVIAVFMWMQIRSSRTKRLRHQRLPTDAPLPESIDLSSPSESAGFDLAHALVVTDHGEEPAATSATATATEVTSSS